MADIVVQPLGTGWTVRHERLLFERFKDRASALRCARNLSVRLRADGQGGRLTFLQAQPPRPPLRV